MKGRKAFVHRFEWACPAEHTGWSWTGTGLPDLAGPCCRQAVGEGRDGRGVQHSQQRWCIDMYMGRNIPRKETTSKNWA